MHQDEALSSSLEDYLETIFQLQSEKLVARAKDIAEQLDVKSSSVTGALQALAKRKLVNYAPYDVITLTDKGKAFAQDVVRRHEGLRDFFVKVLGADKKSADEAACKMEHAVPRSILNRLVQYMLFLESCPPEVLAKLSTFREFVERGNPPARRGKKDAE